MKCRRCQSELQEGELVVPVYAIGGSVDAAAHLVCPTLDLSDAEHRDPSKWEPEPVETEGVTRLPDLTTAAYTVRIYYTNHRGVKAWRNIRPLELVYAETKWHPDSQWLLRAWDYTKGVERHFALKDIAAWTDLNPEPAPPPASPPPEPGDDLTDGQILKILNLNICPECEYVVQLNGPCGFPQPVAVDAVWSCENDDGEPCGWQGTSRDLVEVALVRAGLI